MRDDETNTAKTINSAVSALCRDPDDEFVLRGIHALPDEVAFLIRGCISDIDLSCVTSLSGAAAAALSRHHGRLDLGGLKELPLHVAEGLACREGARHKVLVLNGIAELDIDEAGAIASYPGDLELNGLRNMCHRVAAELASHRGRLSLNGITAIDHEIARWLAKHHGDISLDGIEKLDDDSASALSMHEGKVSLSGLVELTPAAVRVASLRNEMLYFPRVKHLSEEAAVALAAVKHEQRVANDLTLPVKGYLVLTGLQNLPAEVARPLSQFYGSVCLDGVKLTPDVASILKRNARGINFGHLRSLSDEDAATLARFDGPLDLTALMCLTQEAAAHLAKHIDGPLYLDGLTELRADVAEALRAHTGPLSLNGLQSLSREAAEQFSQHRDELSLRGLKTLSVECARLLAKRKFGTALDGLVDVDTTVADILRGMRRCTRLKP